MASKTNNFIFVFIVSSLLVIQSSSGSQFENEKLAELTERFDKMLSKMETLEVQNVKLQAKTSQQDENIGLLKRQISNLKALLPLKWASNEAATYNQNKYLNIKKDEGPKSRALGRPPSSCQEWMDDSPLVLADGIYLVQNITTKKIQTVFCQLSGSNPPFTFSQQVVGTVDVKTKSVHFYVQRNSSFSRRGEVIPFDEAQLNEGNAFNLTSGTFTVPVKGIYNFQFSAIKTDADNTLDIVLRVNGNNVGDTWTDQGGVGTLDVVSLGASLRLKPGDKVNLKLNLGALRDSSWHYTHFSGWLVEEDLI